MMLSVLLLLFSACPDDKTNVTPDQNPGADLGLNGIWYGNSTTIKVSGNQGIFNSITGGYWENAKDQGFISIGSVKWKSLVKVENSTNKWKGDVLWFRAENLTIQEVKFAANGDFELSADGKTLSVTSTSPFEGESNSETGVYTKVSQKAENMVQSATLNAGKIISGHE